MMGKQRSLRSKAVNIVSDFTTVLLNPISDKISKKSPPENETESEKSEHESNSEEGSEGPDTSSFTAFLYSLLKDDYFTVEGEEGQHNRAPVKLESEPETETETAAAAAAEIKPETVVEPSKVIEPANVNVVRESGGKRGLISRGKQSLGKAMNYAGRLAWFRNQSSPNSEAKSDDKNGCQDGGNLRPLESKDELLSLDELPDMSENSMLLSQKTRLKLYGSLPSLFKGRKWVLLYSTWRHGISLSTLYRKSTLCPGLSLLVVGDRGGAVFGGLVEAPLKPSKSRRYQGSNSTFLFSDVLGKPVIYRPTGANRYYTLCSPDFLALGGGRHFALYLDSDLLNGSSAASETYGNSCLALSEDFVVKEVELWGFVYASRYEEMLALSQNEPPGICRW